MIKEEDEVSADSVSTANSRISGSSSLAPLADVVAESEKAWFQEYLTKAHAGNKKSQVVLGQMYTTGYGVAKDPNEGRLWNIRGLNGKSGALRVNCKRPGYRPSESDSDERNDEVRQQMLLTFSQNRTRMRGMMNQDIRCFSPYSQNKRL